MGLLSEFLRRPHDVPSNAQWTTITQASASFTQWDGDIYRQELTRSCIDRFATACSKLQPEIHGESHKAINKAIRTQPNQYETWPTMLKKVATRYETDAVGYVVPVYARDLITKVGFFSLKCNYAEIVAYKGEPWVRFFLGDGETAALPLREVCILSKYTYLSDFFSDPNCLDETMKLIHGQNEAQKAAIENGAKIRFIGKVNGQMREEDMDKKRKRFIADNLGPENSEGLMLYDQTFEDIKQVTPQSYVINPQEMDRIDKQVYTYFGMNEKILQNDYDEDTWGAWYEGKIEPFAVALGEGLTHLCYTQREQDHNGITFSSNRLQYASNASKRNMIRDMIDRGVFTLNQALEILQLPSIGPEGDIRVIRGEYINASGVSQVMDNTDNTPRDYDSDDVRKDFDPEPRDNDNN